MTFLITLTIRERKENVDGFMVSSGAIGYGFSASSMTATWVWAASFYAAAEAGFIYGISGPIHYGLWGALMILCIYPFGKRFRTLAPHAHTLAEMVHARHGSSSQLMLAVSNIAGSLISLTANFTAAGALVYMLTPFSFGTGVVAVAIGVLAYTIWSGFRASVLTDYIQLVAMMGAAVIIIPVIFFAAGGPDMISVGMDTLREQNPQKADFWSKDAFLYQGAPYMVAVLAYAIGNQTIMQRLFAVRVDHIKSTFVTATLGYAGTVIGLGMLGVLAAMIGMQPVDGNTNNIIPQMGVEFLPAFLIVALFIMVIGSLSSTADSDLSALASIAMTDIYGKNIARGRVKAKTMLLVGRMTMVGATAAGVALAFASFNILGLLVFVGGLWGALVFPVIASFYWNRITSKAFVISVVVAVTFFLLTRFELIPMFGVQAVVFELLSALGAASAVGLLAFGVFGRRAGFIAAAIMFLAMVPLFLGFLRDYPVLLSALVAYGISTALCVAISLRSNERFDFDLIDQRVLSFQGGATRKTTLSDADAADTSKYEAAQSAHRSADVDNGGSDADPKGGGSE
ncbi:sodium:solute symporter family transporter [Corynebacterium sp. A21]|uniref:sodium:solute symporter family transporter n=1 Tax=Corynebacterium sp. A21 TaxID=3457318 RepID=UPI003FD1CE11